MNHEVLRELDAYRRLFIALNNHREQHAMTPEEPTNKPYPPAVMEELDRNRHRLRALVSAQRIWDRTFTPAEREQLGGNFEQAYTDCKGTIGMWMKVRGVSLPRAIIEAAFALPVIDDTTRQWLLREISEGPKSLEDQLQEAIAAGNLVLVERPRQIYWKGNLIEVDWNRNSALWNFMWILCEQARTGAGVDYTLFGEEIDSAYVSKTKNRLRNTDDFPSDLANLIRPVGRGTQKLNVPKDQITLFRSDTTERLEMVSD